MKRKKRFLFLGASNDDCEFMAGGLAMQLLKRGHHVAFACVIEGDADPQRHRAMTEEARGVSRLSIGRQGPSSPCFARTA